MVGVKPPEDVCLETNPMPYALPLALTDGSMMPNLVLEKSTLVCSPTLLLKQPDLLPLNKPNLNNMSEPYYTIKL